MTVASKLQWTLSLYSAEGWFSAFADVLAISNGT